MNKNEKIWAILVHLSMSEWGQKYDELLFDDEVWDYVVEESHKNGLNMIVLDVGDGVKFDSHPEICAKDAWSKERVHKEIARCREKGIALIPKLNFATIHDIWLGDYHKMVTTDIYYKVCSDLIKEVYEIFEQPEYIHIGMDEEHHRMFEKAQLATYRQGELYWHDIRFFMDCVKATGAKVWMWADPLVDFTEGYRAHIKPDEAILSPWYYSAYKKEHWQALATASEVTQIYYREDKYVSLGIEYVEEDPHLVNFRKVPVDVASDGYKYVPCCSSLANKYNSEDLLDYYKENVPDDQILGYITAPWKSTTKDKIGEFERAFKEFPEAIKKIYG